MKPVQFYIVVALSAACLILSMVGMAMTKSNQHLQGELQQQQEEISRGNAAQQMRSAIIRDIAQTAIDKKDNSLKDVLTRAGFSVQQNPAPGAAPGTSPSTTSSNDTLHP